jgi:hypothetical protein
MSLLNAMPHRPSSTAQCVSDGGCCSFKHVHSNDTRVWKHMSEAQPNTTEAYNLCAIQRSVLHQST